MDKKIYNEKKLAFTQQYDLLKKNFQHLKKILKSYEGFEIHNSILKEIQWAIDDFIHQNDIKVCVHVLRVENSFFIMGATLEDNIIWESIQ